MSYVFCAFLLTSHATYAQDTTTLIRNYPRFDVHLGAGWVSGGRVGARIQVNEDCSFETSIGYHIENFMSLSDEETKYGIGVNWHNFAHSHLTLSMLAAYGEKIHLLPNSLYLLSLNIGYLTFKSSGINFFARGGAYIGMKKNWAGTSTVAGPNLDLGFGWVFP